MGKSRWRWSFKGADRVSGAGLSVVLRFEERWYRQHDVERGNRQFVVADPYGYLLRFYEDVGSRNR